MTIKIHNPEFEQLLQQRIKAGNFANVEDMLLDTLRREEKHTPPRHHCASGQKL